jgi:hypothetical protein
LPGSTVMLIAHNAAEQHTAVDRDAGTGERLL